MNKAADLPIELKDENEYDSYQMKKFALPLLAKSGADAYEIAVYWAIKQLCNWKTDEGKIYISTIAKYSGQSERNVQKQIDKLKNKNFLLVTKNYNPEKKQYLANTFKLLSLDKIAVQMSFVKKDAKNDKEQPARRVEDEVAATLETGGLKQPAYTPSSEVVLLVAQMKEKYKGLKSLYGNKTFNIAPILDELERHKTYNANKVPMPVTKILEVINSLDYSEVQKLYYKIEESPMASIDSPIPYMVTILYNAAMSKASGIG